MPTVAGQVEHPERLATQEVSYTSEGTKIPSYLARPRENGRYPGIVILHDIFGVSDHARDVARRFANVGFAVLVPDCFARIEIGTDETIDKIRVRAAQLEDHLTVRDIEGAAALLRSMPYCNGKAGTVGFCMGGRTALLLACSSDKIDATIDCWGGSVTPDTGTSPLHPVPRRARVLRGRTAGSLSRKGGVRALAENGFLLQDASVLTVCQLRRECAGLS